MKIEIISAGVYDKDGNEIEVGTTLTIDGDVVPAWLVNKARLVAGKPVKAEAVTNPAKAD